MSTRAFLRVNTPSEGYSEDCEPKVCGVNKREYRDVEHNPRLRDSRGRAFKWSCDGAVVIARGL